MTLPATYKMWADRQHLCHAFPDAAGGKHLHVGGGRRFCYTQQQAIMWSAQWLIERLYVPCSLNRHPWGVVTGILARPFSDEAINWGDLSVMDVRRLGKSGWLVEIEEAAPDSPAFCRYIQSWLTKWGWENVEVRTEW